MDFLKKMTNFMHLANSLNLRNHKPHLLTPNYFVIFSYTMFKKPFSRNCAQNINKPKNGQLTFCHSKTDLCFHVVSVFGVLVGQTFIHTFSARF